MNDCIFCKIGAGQVKATLVYEDDRVVAFRDAHPQAPVHILIIPKEHIDRVSALTEQTLPLVVNIHRAAIKIAEQEGIINDGFRLVTNSGKMSGQTVNHLHYHLMAGRKLSWPPG